MAVVSNGASHSLPTLVGDHVPRAPKPPTPPTDPTTSIPGQYRGRHVLPTNHSRLSERKPKPLPQAPGAAMTGITGLMRLTKPNSHQGTENQQATGRLDRRTRLSIRSSIRSSTRSTPISFDPTWKRLYIGCIGFIVWARGSSVLCVSRVRPTLVGYGNDDFLPLETRCFGTAKWLGMAQLSLPVCEI